METPSNTPNKQKAGEAPAAATTQALQVVLSAPLTSLSGQTQPLTLLESLPPRTLYLWSCRRLS
ncbi:UNVERIFIED_CONTAM: hypothetical protein Slati_3128400 [Sesamum latifolium]|uniref:Uncharacterized protein n=1 Tax=Sesamum latifolium TaxID=2727402 RepID=A0AAW2UVV9_9LAMI